MVLVVVIMSLVPAPDISVPFPAKDKAVHLLAYFTLMSWFGCIYLPGKKYLLLGLVLLSMGIVLEFIQGMTSYRNFEYKDMMVNGLGIFLGWLVSRTRVSAFLIFIERQVRPE